MYSMQLITALGNESLRLVVDVGILAIRADQLFGIPPQVVHGIQFRTSKREARAVPFPAAVLPLETLWRYDSNPDRATAPPTSRDNAPAARAKRLENPRLVGDGLPTGRGGR
jgi:hypothetical protein